VTREKEVLKKKSPFVYLPGKRNNDGEKRVKTRGCFILILERRANGSYLDYSVKKGRGGGRVIARCSRGVYCHDP